MQNAARATDALFGDGDGNRVVARPTQSLLVVVLARFQRVFHLTHEWVMLRHARRYMDCVLRVVFLLDPRGNLRRNHWLRLRKRIIGNVEPDLLDTIRRRRQSRALSRLSYGKLLPVPALWPRNPVPLARLRQPNVGKLEVARELLHRRRPYEIEELLPRIPSLLRHYEILRTKERIAT